MLIQKKSLFEKNTDRLIIISMNLSCDSKDECQLVKYLKANLSIDLKRRAENLSCEILQDATDKTSVTVKAEFLLGLMEKPRVLYGISHLMFLTMKKFQNMGIEIDGNKLSSDMTDEGLKKLFKNFYERLKKDKE